MGKQNRSKQKSNQDGNLSVPTRATANSESPTTKIILALIAALATIAVAVIGYSATIKGTLLPIEFTQTAEARHTAIAMTSQTHLPESTITPIPTITSAIVATSTPSPTLAVDSQLVQLIDNYYACINFANRDTDSDYEKCWDLLSSQQGEFQSHLNKEDFKAFWRQYRVTYVLYYCPSGTEKFVDAEYYLYQWNDLSAPIGDKFIMEYAFALDSNGWRIKSGNGMGEKISSYCESYPRVEKLTVTP